MYGLSAEAASDFGTAMRARSVRKVYYAFVRGFTDTTGDASSPRVRNAQRTMSSCKHCAHASSHTARPWVLPCALTAALSRKPVLWAGGAV